MQQDYNYSMEEKLLTTTQAAEILGLNRTQVFRLVKQGKIPAQRIGRNYFIKADDLGVGMETPTEKQEKQIQKSVDRIFKEYGDVIKKLGEE